MHTEWPYKRPVSLLSTNAVSFLPGNSCRYGSYWPEGAADGGAVEVPPGAGAVPGGPPPPGIRGVAELGEGRGAPGFTAGGSGPPLEGAAKKSFQPIPASIKTTTPMRTIAALGLICCFIGVASIGILSQVRGKVGSPCRPEKGRVVPGTARSEAKRPLPVRFSLSFLFAGVPHQSGEGKVVLTYRIGSGRLRCESGTTDSSGESWPPDSWA